MHDVSAFGPFTSTPSVRHGEPRPGEAGFTLIELLVATTIMLMVATAVGTFVAGMWHSVTNSTQRVDETQEAQKISQIFETDLTNAVCVGGGNYSFPFITTGWQTAYTPYLAENCPQPGFLSPTTNPANLISYAVGSGSGNDQLYFWEGFDNTTICNSGSPPCADVQKVYLVAHTISGFTTHWLAIQDLKTGVVSYIGDDISSLSLYYYDQATPSCTGNGIGAPPRTSVTGSPPGNNVGSVRMVLGMQNATNAPEVTYSTCIYLPND